MKLRKRFAAIAAAMAMAVSMMSIGANASYSDWHNKYIDSAFGPAAIGGVYQERENGSYYTLGTVYCHSVSNPGSVYDVYGGMQSTTWGAYGYTSVYFGSTYKGSTDDAYYNGGIEWTDAFATSARTVRFLGIMIY